jgi:hypothetical protein
MESLNIVSIVTAGALPNRSNTISLIVYCLIGTWGHTLGLTATGIYRAEIHED